MTACGSFPLPVGGRAPQDPFGASIAEAMTDTQKDLFSPYQNCVREFQATAECLLFQNSFCLGAKMMMAIYEEQIH